MHAVGILRIHWTHWHNRVLHGDAATPSDAAFVDSPGSHVRHLTPR